MSNSGRIGGKRSSVTHRMKAQGDRTAVLPEEGGLPTNRAHRKAFAAMARKNKDKLLEVSQWAVKVHQGDAELAKRWMYQRTEMCGGHTPLEWVLMGRGDEVLKQLKEVLPDEA